MLPVPRTALCCVLALALAALAAAPARADGRQLTVMQDDGLLFRSGPAARDAALDEMASLGADVIKAQVYWNEIAPQESVRPSGFDASDPESYDWGRYDGLVRAIVARGMRPYLALGNRAPAWAVGKRTRSHDGSYWPDAREFGEFATAAGRRYSGDYEGLPRVELWSVWNEPNLGSWLAPQRSKQGVPLAPSIYRGLYLAAHRGLAVTGHGADTILLGELMPLGSGSRTRFTPLDFLREMVCLDRRFRQYRGAAARARRCTRVGRIPASGIAHHPYTRSLRTRPKAGEAPITALGALARRLDLLARRGKLPRGLPIWLTEYGFQTDPPDPYQFPIRQVPGLMDESEWIAFRNRRVRSYSQYTLRDEGLRPSAGPRRYASFQMGLRFATGGAKRGVYDAFRMPAFVRLLGRIRVEIFGGLRTAGGEVARIESRRRGGSYRFLAQARLNDAGYFRRVAVVRGAATRKFRITIRGHARVKRPVRR